MPSTDSDADMRQRILSQDRKGVRVLEVDDIKGQISRLRDVLKDPQSQPMFVKRRIGIRRRELQRRGVRP